MSDTKEKMTESQYRANAILRLAIFAVILVSVIVMLVENFDAVGNILITIIGFGMVVLIHEFGHFIVAKMSNIKVEAFSMGFSPILLGILKTEHGFRVRVIPGFWPKRDEDDDSDRCLCSFTFGPKCKPGETEYRIGMIPFGGFVKMLGQEDTAEVEKSDDPRSYANKPVFTRMAVIAAGVIFNAISALIVFIIVFSIGISQQAPVVGGVVPGSPAEKAGIKPGDLILEVAGRSKDLDYSDVIMAAALSASNESIEIKVRHLDGTEDDFSILPESMETDQGDLRLFGLMPAETLTIAKVTEEKILRERTGLMPGDTITAVDGRPVENMWQFEDVLKNLYVPKISLTAKRTAASGEVQTVHAAVNLDLTFSSIDPNSDADLGNIYSIVPRLKVNSTPIKSDLKDGDIIVSVAGTRDPTYLELRKATESYVGKEMPLSVLRTEPNGLSHTLAIKVVPKNKQGRAVIGIGVIYDAHHPVVAKTVSGPDGPEKLDIPRGALITAVNGQKVSDFFQVIDQIHKNAGKDITLQYRLKNETSATVAFDAVDNDKFITVAIGFSTLVPFKPLEQLYKANSLTQALAMGYRRSVRFLEQAVVTLKRLVAGMVSPKSFVGPLGIVKLSYGVVKDKPSLVYYAYFLGLISTFIAVMNMMPLLPFDGGHIVFLAAEKVKGSPVSERVQASVLYAGLILVGVFFIYVTYNDIMRFFSK